MNGNPKSDELVGGRSVGEEEVKEVDFGKVGNVGEDKVVEVEEVNGGKVQSC